jgi:hypothetical protein
VPDRYQAALVALAQASQTEIEALLSALGERTDRLATSALAARVHDAIPRLERDEATRVVEAILSLIGQERGRRLSRDAISQAIAHSPSLDISDTERASLVSRLARVLGLASLRTALKAHDLMTEHSHLFADVRIFSDVRPVFGDLANEPPVGSVIIETLKIEYFDESLDRRAFFVALDHLDLEALKEVVDRAVEKTKTLRKHVVEGGMPLWEYEDEISNANID